jgi:outer membrane protein assembly factor BamB
LLRSHSDRLVVAHLSAGNCGGVNQASFGKLFTQAVDGVIVGHPLYLPNVAIPLQGTHNVAYVATMHDSVYAFDADGNAGTNANPLWQKSLLVSGATPVPISVQGCGRVTVWTEVGVVSTPVIDPMTGTFYVVAKTEENGAFVHRLHALDVATGNEKFGGPIKIAAQFTSGVKGEHLRLRR